MPAASSVDLGLSHPTHFEGFNIFVPYGNAKLDEPSLKDLAPVTFDSFFAAAGQVGRQASISGPVGFGSANYVPLGQALPYSVAFENPATANSSVAEIRIVQKLDSHLDPRTFRLGDIKIGDIKVHIPGERGAFSGDFDFTGSKGFVLRVSAGLDFGPNTVSYVLQAIDPTTGEVMQDTTKGLLRPNNADGIGAGFVNFTVQPKADAATGAKIESQARVLFNDRPPQDTLKITHTTDGSAPTTTLIATPLGSGAASEVKWTAADDAAGSGVKSVTVFVAEDGGALKIWKRQTTDVSGIYQGTAGHTYEFLALATDNAGNREKPSFGLAVPDDGSGANLGTLPTAPVGVTQGPPATPSTLPSTNPIFTEAAQAVPALQPATGASGFATVLRPFTGRAFASGIAQSHAGIGPLAIAIRADGSAIISGGAARNQLFNVGSQGGAVGAPLAMLPYPIFDLAFDAQGGLRATTGGGPLLQLNPTTGAIIGEQGDGITQALAIQPGTGKVFVSSGAGVEVFDPSTSAFTHFSDVRVGNLAFNPADGKLWAATWPSRGDVVRFDAQGKAETMLRFDSPVDSLSFGPAGSALSGLLFASANAGATNTNSELTMVDLATLKRVAIGTGGSRGDVVRATSDGRVLLSQSTQVDVFSLALAPKVIGSNPTDGALVILPRGSVTIRFDQAMFVGQPGDALSVLNANNYELRRSAGGLVPVQSVSYDAATHAVTLGFDALEPEGYDLVASSLLRGANGLPMANAYRTSFTAVDYFAPSIELQFANARSNRAAGTISYDIVLKNTGDFDLLAPLLLVLAPRSGATGMPVGATYVADKNVYFFDLGGELVGSKLRPGESLPLRTITVSGVTTGSAGFDFTVWTLSKNAKPVIDSTPVASATVGQAYSYQIAAHDPDGISLGYLLYKAPAGMTINAQTGRITWTPTTSSPQSAPVVVLVSDSRGGVTTQEFAINVASANRAPALDSLPATINGREGQLLEIAIGALDVDNDALTYFVDNIPPGGVFDAATRTLRWTPGANDAGTYPNVKFLVTDGKTTVERTTTLLIAAVNQAPTLTVPADRTIREGDTIRFSLNASDAESAVLCFGSGGLPMNATLDPATGIFEWTPAFTQKGTYDIPFSVSDGAASTSGTTRTTVLNANGAPVFEEPDLFQVLEGQQIRFRAFALDPDNPSFEPLDRNADGSLTITDDSQPTVTYSVSGLPAGATFDADTGFFTWTPGFAAAGLYNVVFTATDSGYGTGATRRFPRPCRCAC